MLYLLISVLGIILFEISNVYFIMPMPGSQGFESIDIAYLLYTYRWIFRIIFICIGLWGLKKVFTKRPIISTILILITLTISYFINFEMQAEKMFLQPNNLILKTQNENQVPLNKLIVGVYENGIAKAYPVQFIAYHHQVVDDIEDKKIMVTYCSVCRTGRVFEPKVDNQYTEFRLVGMDHFNAMFEDEETGSWWRQVNGEAIKGEKKGELLPEIKSYQMSLEKWLELYPQSLIMQEDSEFKDTYARLEKYETGEISSGLVGTNKDSWEDKSWVLGIIYEGSAKAYDWNKLLEKRYIIDKIDGQNIVIVLSDDNKSFNCFQLNDFDDIKYENDIITVDSINYKFNGEGINSINNLQSINSYQEFWHSWKTFNPNTLVYK